LGIKKADATYSHTGKHLLSQELAEVFCHLNAFYSNSHDLTLKFVPLRHNRAIF